MRPLLGNTKRYDGGIGRRRFFRLGGLSLPGMGLTDALGVRAVPLAEHQDRAAGKNVRSGEAATPIPGPRLSGDREHSWHVFESEWRSRRKTPATACGREMVSVLAGFFASGEEP